MKNFFNKYISYCRQGVFFEKLLGKLVNGSRPIFIHIFSCFPIKKNKVCFDNFEGSGFGGDPKYICIELINRKLNNEIIWFVNKKHSNFPTKIKQVKINSIMAIYHQTTSKVWVDNTRTGHRTKKRPGQYYLQTWHANILAKKIEKDAEDKLWPSYIPSAKYDGAITDAFIVANKRYLDVVRESFWLNKDVNYLKIGSPANDILFEKLKDYEYCSNIKKELSIKENDYIVLYAPSFRDNGSTAGYKIELERVRSAFRQKTKRECVVLVRFHPDVVAHDKYFEYSEHIINVTRYSDVKDLSLISDCLITDYSSITYDFLLQRKPIFRLCVDFEEYKAIRDVYDDFYNMPYSLAYSNKELLDYIIQYNELEYQTRLDDYFSICPIYDNGTAAEKAVDWIESKLIENT